MNTIKKYIAYTFTVVMALTYSSCSSDINDFSSPRGDQEGTISFVIEQDGQGVSRATTSASMKTTFETGDMVGIFAVKDGKVVEGISNIPLTYNEYGSWETATSIVYDKDKFNGVQFYAYYPYSEIATFDPTLADPFSPMVSNHNPSMLQSDKKSYNAADLMTTPGATVDESAQNTVKLSMRHRMSMVCIELPNASYVFPDQDIDAYVVSKATDETFLLGTDTIVPFKDDATQQYRFILKPSTTETLNVCYTNNTGERETYEISSLANLRGGQYVKHVINGGARLKEWDLQVGDYYCADGHLLSKDATAEEIIQKGDVIGVIFKIGTPTTVQQAGSHLSHAEVLSLSSTDKLAWGVSKSCNTTNWKTWYTKFGMSAPSTTTVNGQKIPKNTEANLQEVGLTYTQNWLSIPSSLTYDNVQQDYVSEFKKTYAQWTSSNTLPSGIATSWYVPSLREWLTIKEQTTILESQIKKAGGDTLWKDDFSWGTQIATGTNMGYWSCNVRSEDIVWQFTGLGTNEHPEYDYSAVKVNAAKMYYRFMFAF